MKIGTDSVLLGAWTTVSHKPLSILDIGAGTGILSLMLAQRTEVAHIEAIEIDGKAFEECAENFENSPWADRLSCYHASLLEFVEEVDDTFETIICNPPFYKAHYKSQKPDRDRARFQDAMPFEHLIYAVSKLLSENGNFSVVVPFEEEDNLIDLCQKAALKAARVLRVRGHNKSPFKRSLIEFNYNSVAPQYSDLTIETERHNYTAEYKRLTRDFYLKL